MHIIYLQTLGDLFKNPLSHLKDLLTFFRENCLVSLELFVRIKHGPRPVGFGIILELKCVSGYKGFGRTYKTAESIFLVFDKTCVHCVRSVAGHYKQNRNGVSVTAWSFGIVSQILENQPFIQSAERCSHFRKIIWRTDDIVNAVE